MNDFSKIPSESPVRDEMTISPTEGIEYEYPVDDTIEPDLASEDEMTSQDPEPDDSMDGDFDSGMASAGLGYDEQYGYYGGGED